LKTAWLQPFANNKSDEFWDLNGDLNMASTRSRQRMNASDVAQLFMDSDSDLSSISDEEDSETGDDRYHFHSDDDDNASHNDDQRSDDSDQDGMLLVNS
jgi:hypothetical protein